MSTFYSKINKNLKNIWRYAAFYPPIKEENRLTLGEGNTPEISAEGLAKDLGLRKLIFKREDLNPSGSHKDRLLAYQVSTAKENGEKILIISSSGNAAVSASAYCKLAGIKLFVFVSPKTDKEKLAAIAKTGPSTSFGAGATIIVSKHALTLADLAAKKFGIKNLRPGADANYYYGLKSIAFEIFERCGEIDAIFIPTSSASTLLATAEAHNDLIKNGGIDKMPEIYAVQTAKIHPIAENFDKDFVVEKESSARGIVSKNIPREKLEKILKVIKESGGGGVAVSNKQIAKARKALEQNNIITGYESAASFAGVIKLKEKISGKKIVVLLTGKKWNDIMQEVTTGKNIFKADDISEVEKIIKSSEFSIRKNT